MDDLRLLFYRYICDGKDVAKLSKYFFSRYVYWKTYNQKWRDIISFHMRLPEIENDGIVRIMIMNIYFNLQDVVKIPSHLSLLQIALRFVADSTQQQQLWKIKGKRHDYKNARFRSQPANI